MTLEAPMLVVLMLAAAGVLVAMGAMNSLLGSAQVVHEQAGGVESLAWRLPPSGIVEDSKSILRAWSGEGVHDVAADVMYVYFFADLVYILLYVLILRRVWTLVASTIEMYPPPNVSVFNACGPDPF